VVAALEAAGWIVLPEGVTPTDVGLELSYAALRIPVLDDQGQPVVVDGEPVTARDWVDALGRFSSVSGVTQAWTAEE
jgi:hypothetical protein